MEMSNFTYLIWLKTLHQYKVLREDNWPEDMFFIGKIHPQLDKMYTWNCLRETDFIALWCFFLLLLKTGSINCREWMRIWENEMQGYSQDSHETLSHESVFSTLVSNAKTEAYTLLWWWWWWYVSHHRVHD